MPALRAELEYLPAVNFAMQQVATVVTYQGYAMHATSFSYIQKIVITNLTDSRIDNVWFTLSFEPQFAENISVNVGSVMPGQVIEIGGEKLDIKLSFDFLVGLTERIKGYNVIDLCSGNTLIYHEKYDVVLLALDECPLNVSPEFTASFVMPNHPVLTGVLRRAGEIRCILDGNGGLNGYSQLQQCNPESAIQILHAKLSVENQIKSIYTALKELEITYVLPPRDFFNALGQRVRLADEVVTRRLGTCFDTSILFASCFEAAGLDPLIILTHNHAFVGCFLEDELYEDFEDCIIDDADVLKELYDQNLIELIETTTVTKGHNEYYEKAKHIWWDVFSKKSKFENFREEFEGALNIKVLRKMGFQPLPQRVLQEYWDHSNRLLTLPPDHPAALPGGGEISAYSDDLYYIYLNEIVYGPYRLDQMVDLPLLPDTLVTTNKLNGEWYEARYFGCFAHKFMMVSTDG